MAGLLDFTPDQWTMIGLLGAGLQSGQGFGPAAERALLYAAQAEERKQKRGLLDMQMEQQRLQLSKARREEDADTRLDQAARSSFITPEQAAGRSMGPMPDGGVVPQVQPGFDSRAYLQQMYQIDPRKAVAFEQSIAKDDAPIKLGSGESLYDRKTLKPLATAPKEQSTPAAIQEYQFAVNQGYKGTFEQWDTARKRAGATSVTVNSEKPFINELAGGLGKSLVDARSNAQAALGTLNTVNRVADALDSGKVITGPGATFRTYGLQIGQVLGVGGKDSRETLANTRQAIQGLAQLELDAAAQMKGQGTLTEGERAVLKRAAAGDIENMTPAELRVAIGAADKTARLRIQGYRAQVQPLSKMQGAQAITPFLDVQEPPPRSTPGVLRFDAQGNLIQN